MSTVSKAATDEVTERGAADACSSRLHIPAQLYALDALRTALFMGYALASFSLPALAAACVVTSTWPGWLRALLVLPLSAWAGHGLHLLGWVAHEGIHFNLHRNKRTSMLLAIAFSSPIPTYFAVGYGLTHWLHHRYTNEDADPDLGIYAPLHTFWRRVLLSRSRGTRIYLRTTLAVALHRSPPAQSRLPLPASLIAKLARLNIALGVCWLALYAYLIVTRPWIGLVSILLPVVFGYVFSGLRAYVEHAGTDVGELRTSRSYTSGVFDWLFYGNNYHIEHHMFPAVPCYRLKALHEHLDRDGVLSRRGAQVEPSFWGALRYISPRYPYGAPPRERTGA